ncbi:TPA: pilin [Photobacterium damselae]
MKGQKGFTLIELMIVVAVIGVLSAIAIPAYQDYVKKGAIGSALATATALKTPVEQHIADNGTFPVTGNISAPSFALGTITLAATASTSDASGTIKVKLTTTSANNADVTWTRANGLWKCAINNAGGISLKGCS